LSPFFSERDVEVPQLLNFVDTYSKEITTILDVGCFGSQYLKQLKEKGKIVDGIDLKPSTIERGFLQNYFVGNAVTYPLGKYDLVICLSTIEHAGIKGYRVNDFVKEQNSLFKKVVDASKHFIYVTFPYAHAPSLQEGQAVNMTRNRLDTFLNAIPMANCETRFYFNEVVHAVSGWIEITQDYADKIQYDPAKGCRCVCTLEVIL
jgi:hypothetical protein